jgi:plasmid replication initiation protein
MEHPVFALSTKPDAKVRRYERNGVFVEIAPSVKGHATIFDKDILIYCISQLMEAKNRSREITKRVRITAFDFLAFTNRSVGGRDYELLQNALVRLRGTTITTNIKTGGKIARKGKGFGLIETFEIIEQSASEGQMIAIEITLSDWLFNAVAANETLTIHREYFDLRKALERRLYELARKHCGKQATWQISLQVLYEKSGSDARRNEFRRMLKGIVEDNTLPGYSINYYAEEDSVTFTNRDDKVIAQSVISQLALPVKNIR